jgi:hypothetical protein
MWRVRQAVTPELGLGFLGASRPAIGWLDSLQPGAASPDAAPLLLLTRQPEPFTLVTNESACYHFRMLDPRLPLRPDKQQQMRPAWARRRRAKTAST